jgi:hypothetical protein
MTFTAVFLPVPEGYIGFVELAFFRLRTSGSK